MPLDRRRLLTAAALLPFAVHAQAGPPTAAQIRQQGYLRIATTGANAPYTFVGPDNVLTGFDIDWSRAICAGLGVEARFSRLEWRGILPGLLAGQFDAVMSAVRITPEREAAFTLSAPYGSDDVVVIVPTRNTSVREIEDLRGLTVAAAAGSVQEQVARELANAGTLRAYPGLPDIMLEMRTGRVDAAVVGRGGAAHAIRTTQAPLTIVGRALRPGPLGMVLPPGSTDLVAAVNAVIAARIADGTQARLFAQWFAA
ncbi:transporter substrate-binding domain-containing protein [Humitalea sp. 24SJ18S-53]|uniref:transporter substrate-binding domain-containing protein n=1 Tax=Humitalea sp. 24SJ18S-53 TaxID=3422307 RepID=UPI003D668733